MLKADESLSAARLLHQHGMYNFAVSRAYYAMFYTAEALLLLDSLAFSKHAGVISGFGHYFVKAGRIDALFHRFLIDAQALRTLGDYDPIAALSREQSDEQLERAGQFIAMGLALFGASQGPTSSDPDHANDA